MLERKYGRRWANVRLCDDMVIRGVCVVADGGREWCLVVVCGGW
jgi:hypothetical protein